MRPYTRPEVRRISPERAVAFRLAILVLREDLPYLSERTVEGRMCSIAREFGFRPYEIRKVFRR